MTRYKVSFVCPSTGNVGDVEVDALNSRSAFNQVVQESQIRIQIMSVKPIGRGGQRGVGNS
jgi:hypothetical protein